MQFRDLERIGFIRDDREDEFDVISDSETVLAFQPRTPLQDDVFHCHTIFNLQAFDFQYLRS